jgi:aminomethyltransferase
MTLSQAVPKPALRTTPLDALHRRLGGRMVAFAGWSLPVQFAGTLAEHAQARTAAALFDVSHMGQVSLHGPEAAAALERLAPGDIAGLAVGRQRYTLLTNEFGGIIDDLMVAHHPGRLFVVLNASRAEADIAHLRTHGLAPELHDDRALLALQGPLAAAVIARLAPQAAALPFLGVAECLLDGIAAWISRSGYTGEDGFEISVPAQDAEALATRLLAAPEVAPAGLAARDTLRLEAGLCLYGQDIDMLTSPIEAGLAWTIPKRRRQALDFLGAATIADHLANGPTRRRVGVLPAGRAPARAGTDIAAMDDTVAGTVTSGGFSPTLGAPIAMGYVRRDLATLGTPLALLVRGQRLPAAVAPTPFVPHRFVR